MGQKRAAAASRRAEISELVASVGFVRIDNLAQRFDVTPMTIHRDLDALDALGMVSKVRSGARAMPIEELERNVQLRRHHMLPQKQAIAAAALTWLADQDGTKVVALDDSTTALTLADPLAEREELTVVSNFLPVIETVAATQQASLFALGGTFSQEFQSFLGSSTHEAIRSIQIDVFFLSATSVAGSAAFHPSEPPLLVKRAFIEQAQQSVLLVDHTKFERRALHRQAALHEFDVVIVDDGISAANLERLQAATQQVIVTSVGDLSSSHVSNAHTLP